MSDLCRIVKAYDVRGIVPDQLNETVAEALGAAFAQTLRVGGERGPIVVAHDMRESSPALAAAFAARRHRGRGRRRDRRPGSAPPTCSTTPPARSTCPAPCSPPATTRRSTTASSCAAPARRRSARTAAWPRSATARRRFSTAARGRRRRSRGDVEQRDLLADYAAHLRNLVDLSGIRPLKVVVDAGNGMGGYTVPAVLGDQLPALPLDDRPAVLRARRLVPEPRGQPARAGEPGRPAGGGARARRRPRPGLRRRRRPLLRRRRARRRRSRRPRSPRWSRPASWPSTRAPRSSTT